ncbi:MAG: transglutaminase family protein, partial [Nevskiales bacterium]
MRPLSILLFSALLAFGWMDTSRAAPVTKSAQDADLQTLRSFLTATEGQIDLAKAKLTIDHMINPNVDVSDVLRQLDSMAEQVRAQLPVGATRRARFVILMSYLYQPGPWNDQRPFSYDLDDPFGKNIRNKLLTTYLSTRKGNCVSMPVLFVILAQKIGLDATLSTAPGHLLAKIRDEDGRTINVENTSVGTKTDSSYQQDMHITAQALTNGIYLQWLGKRESVAVMMGTLMEFYGRQGQQARRMAVADLVLAAYPKDVTAMLHMGNAYYLLMKQQYLDRYPTLSRIPSEKRQDFE